MSNQRRLKRSTARSTTVAGAVVGIAGLTLTSPFGAAAAAQAEDLQVINRETVKAELDPSGELESARLYSQLTVLGKGTATVADPSSGKDVRDLDGFSAPMVRDGKAQYSIQVDGREDRRTLSDYTGELPVTLKAEYTLDGEPVEAEDVVGRSGTLEATYTVVNRTAEPTEISYKDYQGKDIVETVDLVTPYVGSLKVLLPSQYSGITADRADVAGDGRGANGISWSLVLFNPLGEPAQQLTWTAEVQDAVLPPANLQVVPVVSGGNAVLQNGLTQIGEGATAATSLTAGAYKIDGKLLELRDGAGKILDGLTQLSDGARRLNTGLADTAAPGAQKLADGLATADTGGTALDSGLGQLLAGGTQLSDGLVTADAGGDQLAAGLKELLAGGGRFVAGLNTAAAGGGRLAEGLKSTSGQPDLSGGSAQLAAGLVKVRDGVAALTDAKGLPAAKAGLQELLFGLDHAPGTLGATDRGGLLQGLQQIAAGLSHPVGAAGPADRGGVKEGLAAVLSADPARPGLPVALAGVTASRTALDGKLAAGGDLDRLVGGATAVEQGVAGTLKLTGGLCQYALPSMPDAHPAKAELAAGCAATFGGTAPTGAQRLQGGAGLVQDGVEEVRASTKTSRDNLVGLETGLGGAVAGLTAIQAGVDQLAAGSATARDGVATRIVPGVEQLIAGLGGAITRIDGELAPGVGQLAAGSQTLADKTAEAAAGAAQLRGGLDQLAGGGGQLAAGAGRAADGAAKLSDGLGLLSAGGVKLKDGLGTAKAGTGKLSDGLGQLSDGGARLAAGLGDAADGSGKIADGVDAVKDGVTQVENGANRLSGEGTSLLAGSANNAAKDNSKKAAMLAAMAAKTADGAMPYGAPEDGAGTAAFSLVLAGADSTAEDSTTRGAAAVALLTLGSLSGFLLRRRFIS